MFPGVAVGAAGAFTVGVKLFEPPPVPFSPGDGGAGAGSMLVLTGVVVVVVVVVGEVDGAGFSFELQAVVIPSKPTVRTTAAIPDRSRSLFILG